MKPSDLPADILYYIASPYTKYPGGIWPAYKEVARISGLLVRDGLHVYCPIVHSHPMATYAEIDPLDHEFWMRVDAPFCALSGGLIVALMEGWRESEGIAEEIKIFRAARKPDLAA